MRKLAKIISALSVELLLITEPLNHPRRRRCIFSSTRLGKKSEDRLDHPPEHRGQAGVPPRMSLRSLSLLCVAASAAAQGSSSRLRVEYLDAPLTIDVATPRFSFAPLHPTRGAALASYRIVVAQVFPSAAPIWDSGVVAATSSLNIGESAAQPARVRTRACSGGSSFLSFSLSSHPSSFCCAFFSDRAQATRARRCRRTRTSRGR